MKVKDGFLALIGTEVAGPGKELADGAVVETVTKSTVILAVDGKRYLLKFSN